MRGKRLCYFHSRLPTPKPRPPAAVPNLQDPTELQAVLNAVLSDLFHNRIDAKTAGVIIYGVQTALSR